MTLYTLHILFSFVQFIALFLVEYSIEELLLIINLFVKSSV